MRGEQAPGKRVPVRVERCAVEEAVSVTELVADVLRSPEAGARAIRGGILRGGGYSLGLLIGAATSAFLLRGLGVQNFGRYATVTALIAIVATVTDGGLTAVGSRELALRPAGAERQQLLRVLVALRILLTGAGVIVATAFAFAVGYDRTMVAGTLFVGLGAVLVNTQQTATIPLMVSLRMGAITGFELMKQVLTLAGIAFLAITGSALLPFFLVPIAVGVVLLLLTPPVVGGVRNMLPHGNRVDAAMLIREALPLALALAMNVLYLRLLLIMVSLIESETRTGLYATAFRVFEMLIALPTLVLAVALPVLAVAGSEDIDRLRYGVQRLTEVSLVVALGLAVAVVGFADPAIHLLGGAEYAGAVPILRIQAWALVPLFLGQVFALALLAVRRQREIALANAVAVVTVLALGLVLIPTIHGRGAALAGVITECALAAALLGLLAHSDRGVVPSFGFVWRPLVALLAGVVALFALDLTGWAQGIVATAAFLVAAVVVRAVPPEVYAAIARRRSG